MAEGRNRKNEPLPQIYLIRDTDLTTFAYELHIFPGDFLRESEFNMRSLMTNTGADSIAIMGKNICGFPTPYLRTVPQGIYTR